MKIKVGIILLRQCFICFRYVNRKGVALPTTSEEKKRAKRENLKQKQILIPELCDIHPFPATLWRKAVCLPCILHRINALLLADQVRMIVAEEIGVGSIDLNEEFNWNPLNFGWSLADVLKQTKLLKKQREETPEAVKSIEMKDESDHVNKNNKDTQNCNDNDRENDSDLKVTLNDSCNTEIVLEESNESDKDDKQWVEIGTWSNDMADDKLENIYDDSHDPDEIDDLRLPKNLTMIEETEGKEINDWDSKIFSEMKDSVIKKKKFSKYLKT